MSLAPTILFAGGGTGGHLFPGIAVSAELSRRDPKLRIVFVGSSRSIESTIVAERGLEHRMLPVEPLPTLKRNPLRFVYRNWKAWRAAKGLLKELTPSAVVGLGGYASAPLVWCARQQQIPVILIEQNVIPGKTTRWLSRYADEICISFPGTEARLPKGRNIKLTGNPVRAEIVALNQRAFSECHPESASPELLILGGSQGADSLNAAVLAAIGRLSGELSGWKIVHQTGPRDIDTARQTYLKLGLPAAVEPFFHDMATLYSRSTIVISRSGATTLAELACIGTAMILLPYPHAADDHQMANAKAFVDCQAALLQKHEESLETTADHLASKLRLLLNDSESRTRMGLAAKGLAHPDAAEQIASVIQAAINRSNRRTKNAE